MSARREEFALDDHVHLDLGVKSGSVSLRTGSAGSVAVTVEGGDVDDWDISQLGGSITVQAPRGRGWATRSSRVHVDLPAGSDVSVTTVSADVTVAGRLGAMRAKTASADLRADELDRLDFSSASGDVRAVAIASEATCTTASGDVELSTVGGRLTVTTASGDVRVALAGDDVQVGGASGDVRVDRFDGANIAVKSMSGDVVVGLPSGIRVEPDLTTLSGRTTLPSPASPSADDGVARRVVRVRLKTVSGNITIKRV